MVSYYHCIDKENFDAMVRIGCIASFYHSKIIAEFNQRWMIQL
jgi:hypothetical protein